MPDPVHVLFLCTGNSARSILSESILNHLGKGRLRGFSAGSQPKGAVNPLALETLRRQGHDIGNLRSKSWDEFATPTAPAINIVVTVCGNAANETCPVWPGQPVQVHWGFEDPSDAQGTEEERLRAFAHTYSLIETRLRALLDVPMAHLSRQELLQALRTLAAT